VISASHRRKPSGHAAFRHDSGFMDLSGHHSNPLAPLEALLDCTSYDAAARLHEAEDGRICCPETPREPIGAAHPRQGRIIDAIAQVLSDRGGPMQARDVHAQVETLLGERVRWASIKATLAGNLDGPVPRFVRVARGVYSVRISRADRQQTSRRQPQHPWLPPMVRVPSGRIGRCLQTVDDPGTARGC